jgi:hypothetical protein
LAFVEKLRWQRAGIRILIERVSERSGPLQAPARQLTQIGDQLRQDEAVAKFESTVERRDRWGRTWRGAPQLLAPSGPPTWLRDWKRLERKLRVRNS